MGRLTLIIALFVIAYGTLVFHLYTVQLTNNRFYLARAESQYLADKMLEADRGSIFFTDRARVKLAAASNKDMPLIFAVPKEVEDPAATAAALAPVLKQKTSDVKKLLSKPNDAYELLDRKADSDVADAVSALKLKGIYVESVPERFYPLGEVGSQLLGFVAPNSADQGESGKYGLEEYYNGLLSGVSGKMQGGRVVAPQPGKDLTLTIDPNVQLQAGRIIGQLVKKWSATGGTVIVMEPQTGKILAMDSVPRFDPNNYSASPIANFLNPVTQKIYEPGSVVKVLTMAAGIDAGKITPDTTYDDTGVLEVNGRKIYNWDLRAHGVMTMTNVIEQSLNTGAAFAERKTGDKVFTDYMVKFGFSDRTGIDLPGEVKGDMRNLNPKAQPIAFATASFGQGIAVTSLSVLNALSSLANGGVLMRPYVNSELEPQEIRRVVSEDTAKKVIKMMVSAVDKAKIAAISGYSIAGKTGTAQVPDHVHGGYSDKLIDTYIGFGPTSDPKFIILLRLDEPAGNPLAGETVVPAFHDLAQFLVNYYNIPPDRLDQ